MHAFEGITHPLHIPSSTLGATQVQPGGGLNSSHRLIPSLLQSIYREVSWLGLHDELTERSFESLSCVIVELWSPARSA